MRILCVFNPVSGGGRAASLAARAAEHLRGRGHHVLLVPTRPQSAWTGHALASVDCLIISGGDGAVRMAAPWAMSAGTPIYHLPGGTANVLAGHFGMTARPEHIAAAVEGGERRMIDVGFAGNEAFLLMAGIGIDARIVHDLDRRRSGRISRWSYAGPMLRQLWAWRGERMSVQMDGAPWPTEGPGMLIVANASAYAQGLDPVRMAKCDDGRLDAAWMPASGAAGALGWAWSCIRGSSHHRKGWSHGTGQSIEVQSLDPGMPLVLQLDGDAMPLGADSVRFTVEPSALAIVAPACLARSARHPV